MKNLTLLFTTEKNVLLVKLMDITWMIKTNVFKKEPTVLTGNNKVELVYNVLTVTDCKKDGVTHVPIIYN